MSPSGSAGAATARSAAHDAAELAQRPALVAPENELDPAALADRIGLGVVRAGGAGEPPHVDPYVFRADTAERVRVTAALQRTVGNKAVSEMVATQQRRQTPPPAAATPVAPRTPSPARPRHHVEPVRPHLRVIEGGAKSDAAPAIGSVQFQGGTTGATDETLPGQAGATVGTSGPTVQRGVADDILAAGRAILGKLQNRASGVIGKLQRKASSAWESVKSAGQGAIDAVASRGTGLLESIQNGWDGLKGQADSAWESLSRQGGEFAEQLRSGLEAAGEALRSGWNGLKEGAKSLWEGLKSRVQGMIDSIKARAGSMFAAQIAPNGAECLTDAALGQAQTAFGPEREAARAAIEGDATGAMAQMTGEWTGLEGTGQSGLLDLGSRASALAGELQGAASGAVESLQGLLGGLEEQASGAVETLRGLLTSSETSVSSEAETAATGVNSEGEGEVGGLRGMLGSLTSSLSGEASGVIGGVTQELSKLVGDIRGKTGEVLRKIRDKGNEIVDGIIDGARRAIDAAREAIAELGRKAAEAWDALGRTWDALKARGAALLDEISRFWEELKGKASAFWNRLKSSLARIAGRANGALEMTEGASCDLPQAAREGEALQSVSVDTLVGEGPVLFKSRGGAARDPEDPALLRAELGRGQPLDGTSRTRMETAFGRPLGPVEVHTDSTAGVLADRVGARAFAVGEHVAFGSGEYRPGTLIGDALLAHELAHVGQGGGPDAPTLRDDRSEDSAIELAADKTAINVVARLYLGARDTAEAISSGALPALRSGLQLRRCAKDKCCEIGEPPAMDLKLAEADHDCEPMPVGRDEAFAQQKLKDAKQRPSVYGHTGFVTPPNGFPDYVSPDRITPGEKCGEHCKLDLPNPPRFSFSPFIYTKAGEYPEGERKVKSGKHFGKRLPAFEVVTPALAERIKEAEKEHCRDHKVAWKKSFGRYIAAVASLQKGFCVPPVADDAKPNAGQKACKEEYLKRLKELSGYSSGPGVAEIGACLHNLTLSERDGKKKHTIKGKSVESVDDAGTKILLTIPDKGALPDLGNPSSEDMVKGCGEP